MPCAKARVSGGGGPHLQPGELVQLLKAGDPVAAERVHLGSQLGQLGPVLGLGQQVDGERQRVGGRLVRGQHHHERLQTPFRVLG